jgi:hypothetical protein
MSSKPPKKRASLDFLDANLDVHVDTLSPVTVSTQIHHKECKLKAKIKSIQLAQRLTKLAQEVNKEKKYAEVYKPPDCLASVLAKISKEKHARGELTNPEIDR